MLINVYFNLISILDTHKKLPNIWGILYSFFDLKGDLAPNTHLHVLSRILKICHLTF